MSYLMTAKAFAEKAKSMAKDYRTLYVMGGFGAPLTAANKARYTGQNANEYNLRPARKAKILAASDDTFALDCVGVLKALFWGWSGKLDSVYGGATYQANGVPDLNADQMIERCSDVSTDFSKIEIGEACWKQGHIGVYVGDGLCVECTPSWEDKVQITAVANIGSKSGYNARVWTKHGKLPWLDYVQATPQPEPTPEPEIVEPFTDVPAKSWFAKAVKWAKDSGIVTGLTDKLFGPNGGTTRAQTVQMLYKLDKLYEKRFKALEAKIEELQQQINS